MWVCCYLCLLVVHLGVSVDLRGFVIVFWCLGACREGVGSLQMKKDDVWGLMFCCFLVFLGGKTVLLLRNHIHKQNTPYITVVGSYHASSFAQEPKVPLHWTSSGHSQNIPVDKT